MRGLGLRSGAPFFFPTERPPPVDMQTPGRNLALELVRATEAAAIRASPFVGRGDKIAVDAAAVDAMRTFLQTVKFDGTVVIGEGEKDQAPMLYNGERVGDGSGPRCDVAVDPVDGTSLAASGRPNAIAMLAVAEQGTLLDASAVFYMEKIVTDSSGHGVVSLEQSVGDNLRELARAKGTSVSNLTVAVLDRPRHAQLIDEVRTAGASTHLLLDGDVAGAILAADPLSSIDLCIGVGGSPEGVATACAVRALDGVMEGRLAPKDAAEWQRGADAGLQMDHTYGRDELVTGEDTIFVATGVTDGELISGVRRQGAIVHTESLILRSSSGTLRRVSARHRASRWFEV